MYRFFSFSLTLSLPWWNEYWRHNILSHADYNHILLSCSIWLWLAFFVLFLLFKRSDEMMQTIELWQFQLCIWLLDLFPRCGIEASPNGIQLSTKRKHQKFQQIVMFWIHISISPPINFNQKLRLMLPTAHGKTHDNLQLMYGNNTQTIFA